MKHPASASQSFPAPDWSNQYDHALAARIAQREEDWRIGPVVYQVFVDRFVEPTNPQAKQAYFQPPRSLRPWSELPTAKPRVPELGCCMHELEFWGGDLQGVRSKLDYIHSLGVDVVYLNPICAAYTNHKYDAQDYFTVSPEYGNREDVKELAEGAHQRGMKLMLDGVFNHMGRTSPLFIEAKSNPKSPWRQWFYFDDALPNGYRGWFNIPNLPELDLENPAVQARIWGDPDSVVRGYLADGVDGWRLDVAYDIGFVYLSDITRAAHQTRPGSAVIGELWNEPSQWMPALDGVMNFHLRQILLEMFDQKISGARAGRLIAQMAADTGIDNLLRCWIILDNHDTPRMKSRIKDEPLRRLARVLQFTLPGAPCVYYGAEVEMAGGDDPANRAPMRWDLVTPDNADLQFFRSLVEMRKNARALRCGDFRVLDCERLLAYLRCTDRWDDTRIVIANPSPVPISEVVPTGDSKLMNFAPLVDEFTGQEVRVHTGLLDVTLPAYSVMVLKPVDKPGSAYSPYKRVH